MNSHMVAKIEDIDLPGTGTTTLVEAVNTRSASMVSFQVEISGGATGDLQVQVSNKYKNNDSLLPPENDADWIDDTASSSKVTQNADGTFSLALSETPYAYARLIYIANSGTGKASVYYAKKQR